MNGNGPPFENWSLEDLRVRSSTGAGIPRNTAAGSGFSLGRSITDLVAAAFGIASSLEGVVQSDPVANESPWLVRHYLNVQRSEPLT